MVLHEYYFDNLKTGGGTGDPNNNSAFRKAAEQSFGGYDVWKAEFIGVGKMRGVGWAICYQNPTNGRLRITGLVCMKRATWLDLLRRW